MKRGAESPFLVCISDHCTVIKECRGGNTCFGTPSIRGTTRGKPNAEACVPHRKRKNARQPPGMPRAGEPGRGDAAPPAPPRAPGPAGRLRPLRCGSVSPTGCCCPAPCHARLAPRHAERLRDVIPRRDTFSPDVNGSLRRGTRGCRLFWQHFLVLSLSPACLPLYLTRWVLARRDPEPPVGVCEAGGLRSPAPAGGSAGTGCPRRPQPSRPGAPAGAEEQGWVFLPLSISTKLTISSSLGT